MSITVQVGNGIRQASAQTGTGKPLVAYIIRTPPADEETYGTPSGYQP